MIISCLVQASVTDPRNAPLSGPSDPRFVAAAYKMLQARPGVNQVDLVSRQPVTFVVTLEDDSFITSLMAQLEVSESFRLVWPDDAGVKATALVPVEFTVTG